MGNVFAGSADKIDMEAVYLAKSQFDPMKGFPNGRKPRVMVATEEEMGAAKLKLKDRDYCAHYALKIEQCKLYNYPFVVRCGAEVHAWNKCEFDDYVLRMKEFERERRLLERQKRKMTAATALII